MILEHFTKSCGRFDMLKNKSASNMVEWAPKHFSWTLVDQDDLTVKLEEIPVEGNSDLHFHQRAFQFFFILEGKAGMHLREKNYSLEKHDGIKIPLNVKHQIVNKGETKLFFLLISCPKVQPEDILA
jgi:mannose-6-phosphate isomerase-like protein (cupin superfamily)